jgi:hypothetical protein
MKEEELEEELEDVVVDEVGDEDVKVDANTGTGGCSRP